MTPGRSCYTGFTVFWTFLKALPRFYVWVLAFEFGSVIYLSDKFAYHLLRYPKRSEYVLKGGCARSGQCCRNLALQIPKSWAKRPKIAGLFNWWYRKIFNFHYLGTIYENWMVYECHYLKNGDTCGIYPYRPKLCREFPLTPLFGHGRLHRGCGFWYLKRSDQGGFQEELAKKEHEQGRREFLYGEGEDLRVREQIAKEN